MKKRTVLGTAGIGLSVFLLVLSSFPLRAAEEMYWDSSFGSIGLGTLTAMSDAPTGSATARLVMTGDVELSADNTTTAQLSEAGGDTLITDYKMTFDGDGGSATGRATVDWASYDTFLSPSVTVSHVVGDDDVDVTLYARAQMDPAEAPNAGNYSATQTITAHWVGP